MKPLEPIHVQKVHLALGAHNSPLPDLLILPHRVRNPDSRRLATNKVRWSLPGD